MAVAPAASRRAVSAWQLAVIGVMLLSAVVYAPAIPGDFVWDDVFLVDGSGIGGGRSLAACFTQPFLGSYYRPLVSVTFFAENRLYAGVPFLYHQTNVALHVLATGLLVAVLLAAFGSRRVALAGAALFAVEPAQVSAVAFIGGRTDALCTVWIALFSLAVVRAARETGRRSARWLALSVAAYALAVLSKEQALLLALLVPLAFRWLAPPGGAANRAQLARLLPFVVVASVFTCAWFTVAPPAASAPYAAGVQIPEAARTLAYYALLLLAPTPRWIHTTSLGALLRMGVWGVALGVAVLAGSVWVLLRWRRTAPAAAWLVALGAVTLIPVSNLVPMPSLQVAPYRAGATGLAVAALLGWGLVKAAERLRVCVRAARATDNAARSRLTRYHAPVCGVLLACIAAYFAWWAGLTVWAAPMWRNPLTLYTALAGYDSTSTLARFNLAATLVAAGRPAPAAAHLEATLQGIFGSGAWRHPAEAARAVDTDPAILVRVLQHPAQGVGPRRWLGELYALLGDARFALGQHDGARQAYSSGAGVDPQSAECNSGLGACALAAGDYRAATRYLLRSLIRDPRRVDARRMLARAYVGQGNLAAARRELAACVAVQPRVCMPYLGLAHVQVRLGDRAGAVRTLQTAIQRAVLPENARRMLADLRAARPYTGPLPFDEPPAPTPLLGAPPPSGPAQVVP